MAEDLPTEQLRKQLIERLDLLERVMATNTARLHGIEKHLGILHQQQQITESFTSEQGEVHGARGTHTPESETKPQNLNVSEAPRFTPEFSTESTPLAEHLPTTPPPPGHSATREPFDSRSYSARTADAPFTLKSPLQEPAENAEAQDAPLREETHRDLESTIGGSWFNWIGIIAVTFGVGFFLKYAFDQQWIGPAGRITLSALLGIGLLYVADRLRRRGLKSYAYVLSGGGILILYLADFAAYNYYHLVSQPTAFLLMAAVTTTAVLLSVRLDALPVAMLGLVGGFLMPVLLSTGVDNAVGLFTYIALLDAGVLAVAYFKRWRSLDFASFAATVVMTLGWAAKFYEPGKLWVTLFFLSVFFLLYSLLAIFHNVLHRRLTQWFDVTLAFANGAFYFGFSYFILNDAGLDHSTPATQAFLLCTFFTGLFYITWRRSPGDLLLRYSYLCAAATYLTIAIAIQLELHWVTIAWAVEGLMLTWVGMRSGEKAARHAGLAVFSVAIGHWFLRDMLAVNYTLDPSFLPLLNRRALSGAALVATLAGAARLYRGATSKDKLGDGLSADERSLVQAFFTILGNTLALTLLTLDINDYFVMRAANSTEGLRARIDNTRQFSISMLWTIYAATMLAIGQLRRARLLRRGGLILLLVAILKVLVLDSAYYAASWHPPLVNQTFMAYALLVASLSFAAWLYRRAPGVGDRGESDEGERQTIVPILVGSASVLALVALSLEVIGYYDRAIAGLGQLTATNHGIFRQLGEGKLSILAIVWTIYALYVFMLGIGRGNAILRFGGLLLLAVTAPLILSNLNYYDAPWHTFIFNRTTGVFAVFIAALWLIVRTYRRSNEVFAEAAAVHHAAIVTANVFAIIALSTQASGYYDAEIAEEFGRARAASDSADGTTLQNLELAKQLSLSVVWALYASGMLIVGQMRGLRLLRVMALALLSITAVKVFIWDLSSLDRVYRIISFIMLGAILLVVSYFYQRKQHPVEEP